MYYFCTAILSGNSSVGRARPCQGRGREFESRFPLAKFAEIAQLVEHDLAKVGVASSSLVFRSNNKCLSGGIGRRAGLKILCPLWTCRFDPGLRYEL